MESWGTFPLGRLFEIPIRLHGNYSSLSPSILQPGLQNNLLC